MTKSDDNIIFVTTHLDSIPGSLRYAINKANTSQSKLSIIIIKPLESNQIILTDGQIIISSNIKLVNASNSDLIIQSQYDVNNQQRIFEIVAPSNFVEIVSKCQKHIILSNGSTNENGGAIMVEQSNHLLLIKNVIIKNNNANASGGGIYTNGNVTLIRSIVLSNSAGSQGGGIYSKGNITLFKSSISNNNVSILAASSGGAGIFVDNGDCVIDNSNIEHNNVAVDLDKKVGGSGGGVVVLTGSVLVQNGSRVEHNTALNSAGIQEGIGNVSVTNKSSVSHNQSVNSETGSSGGGGITMTLGTVTLSDSEIIGNHTKGMYSGGIVSLVGTVVVDRSKISNNTNNGPGGGIAQNVGSISVTDSIICNNTGASLGGGIVNFSPDPGFLSVINSKILDNTLTNGQTIRQTIDSFLSVIINNLSSMTKQADLSGGAGGLEFIKKVPIIIAKITEVHNQLINLPESDIIRGNTIGGGAIACLLNTSVIINNSILKDNFVGKNTSDLNSPFDAYGGAVFGFGAVINIDRTIIKSNRSLTEAGGILSKTNLVLSNSEVINNKTKKHAGGILNDINGRALIIGTLIKENLSGENGGGILNRGNLEIIQSKIVYNGARVVGGGIYSFGLFSKCQTVILNNYPDNVVIV
jgi:predicted outer membrane repeat protein